MTTTPIAAGPLDVTVRALFEQWYLRVVKGHPNNLTRDENGGYKFLATLYLAFEAGMAIERESCAKVAETAAAKMGDLGRQHRDDGHEDSMDRCYARSLQCTQIAADIRTRSKGELTGGPSGPSSERSERG